MFTFDEASHTYLMYKRRLLSVTQIISDNGLINSSNFNDTARSRGSAVHSAIALDLRGKLDIKSLHPDLHGYLESARKFIGQAGLRVIDFEIRAYHPLYLYAGTWDIRYVFANSQECIGDWKTGPAASWQNYQTAAYDMLAPQIKKMRRRYGIHLKADGSIPNVIEHTDASDGQYFLALNAATQVRLKCGQTKEDSNERIVD